MENISKPTKKKDHDIKISGRALYVDDHVMEGMLFGRLLHSAKAKACIKNIIIPQLPKGYWMVDKTDVTGENCVHMVQDDTPVYAQDIVEYVGEPILMLIGPDLKEVERILSQIVVEYQELVPTLDMLKSDTIFFHYNYEKGDIDKVFEEADETIIETFETGCQEHAYLETQGMLAYPENGKIVVRGSMQCLFYVYRAVAKALGCKNEDVRIIQDVTGGAFGGKEDFPSILACQCAVAAKKANRPVKVVLDRREDMEFTPKRHPSICTYKVAIKNGEIKGMDIDVLYNSGAYTTLSPVVLQRGLICSSGVYRIENLRVTGHSIKTNTVPAGAFRGFGAPQTFFDVEMMMSHVAKKLGVNPLALKEKYIAKQGDETSTSGKYHFHVPLPELIERVNQLSNYREKCNLYKNQSGRFRKGVGIGLFFHGCGFTGSGERDIIKAVVKIKKNADDTVEILTGCVDMGQGLKTTFCKIVADTLETPYDNVFMENPDTDRVPDSGPTAASRSLMIVGGLLKKAAEKLKKDWKTGEERTVEEHFVQPDFVIPFNLKKFKGDAYPAYSWGVNVVEVEIDTLTATTKILGAWGVYDVGVPIDMNIIIGQMEGGFLQGLGYASMEQMNYNDKGIIRNNSLSDYSIPTAVDVPNLMVDIINNPYSDGPYGAKGAGEIAPVGVAPAYLEAVENALGVCLNKIPFTGEDVMRILQEGRK